MQVARQACFSCAKRAPPPEKAAARLPTTKKSRAPGKHAQRRRISRAGRACASAAARGAFRFETTQKTKRAGAFAFTQRARRRKGEGEAAAQRFCWRAVPKGAVFLGTPQGRCGQAHMIKSKLQHDQPGIRHANCESDTRIGPSTDLDGRPALVAFRGRSRASSPASNESEGDEHERSRVACHPPSCTVDRTISCRISCHITFFSCHISWKTELNVFACLYQKVVRIGRSSTFLFVITANCEGMETNCTGKSAPISSLKSRTFFFKKLCGFSNNQFSEMPNGGLSHTTNAPRARSGGAPRAPGRLGRAWGCVRTAQEHGGHSCALGWCS